MLATLFGEYEVEDVMLTAWIALSDARNPGDPSPICLSCIASKMAFNVTCAYPGSIALTAYGG
jgi:hypothetical protein